MIITILMVSNVCMQTGSGKTFTITGGAERYSDRGIIPRTLSYFYEQFEQVRMKKHHYINMLAQHYLHTQCSHAAMYL